MALNRKENIGYLSSGKQEVCRWKADIPCPRHKNHGVIKLDASTIKELVVFENPMAPASNMTLEYYLAATEEQPDPDERIFGGTVDDLTELEKIRLEMNGYIEIDDVLYALVEGSETQLDETRIIETEDDLTDIELEELNTEGFINIDGVGYFFNDDAELQISRNSHGQTLSLNKRYIKSIEKDFTTYLKDHGDKDEVLSSEVELWFLQGGCGVYALALQEMNPNYQIAVDQYWSQGEYVYNHVFCIDPETNHAFDSRGEFANPEALMDYKADINEKDNIEIYEEFEEMYEDYGYNIWSLPQANHIIGSGYFTYVDDEEDIQDIKTLITSFKKRYTLS